MAQLTPATGAGWPFLVARTHATGYRLLLVPEVLATEHAYLIERSVAPGDDVAGPAVRTVAAGPATLSLVYRTHQVTTADLDPAGGAGPPVLDEHGRPIVMVYGFLCAGRVEPVAEGDLAVARARALDAYRRVARAGDHVPAERSTAYPLASGVRPVPAGGRPRRAPAGTPGRPVPAPQPTHPIATEPARDRLAVAPRRRGLVLLAGVVAAVLVAIGGWALTRPSGPTPVPPGLIGSWQGPVVPVAAGYPARTITVTISCVAPCRVPPGGALGTATDTIGCRYPLTLTAITGSKVTLAVSAGGRPGCLPAGQVELSGGRDAADLIWRTDGPQPRVVLEANGLHRL